jgi:hypothetical protein
VCTGRAWACWCGLLLFFSPLFSALSLSTPPGLPGGALFDGYLLLHGSSAALREWNILARQHQQQSAQDDQDEKAVQQAEEQQLCAVRTRLWTRHSARFYAWLVTTIHAHSQRQGQQLRHLSFLLSYRGLSVSASDWLSRLGLGTPHNSLQAYSNVWFDRWPFVGWFDNYNASYSMSWPAVRQHSLSLTYEQLNLTVFAVRLLPASLCAVEDLACAADTPCVTVLGSELNLGAVCHAVTAVEPLAAQSALCSLLDLRAAPPEGGPVSSHFMQDQQQQQQHVSLADFHPMGVQDENVASSLGLATTLSSMLVTLSSAAPGRILPVLCDVNIYTRAVKVCFCMAARGMRVVCA